MRYARQPDLVAWAREHASELKQVRSFRIAEATGIVGYLKQALAFCQRRPTPPKAEGKDVADKTEPRAPETLSPEMKRQMQHAESQDLLRMLKWRRATWDDNVDFATTSRRMLNASTVFRKARACSYLNVHFVKDTSVVRRSASKWYGHFSEGALTRDFFSAEPAEVIAPYSCNQTPRGAPATPNWDMGVVYLLDSISPQEMLAFTQTLAPQIQAVQMRMEQEQQSLSTDLELLQRRLNVDGIRYNSNNASFWDDPDRTNPDYVTPVHLRQFADSAMREAAGLRFYLRRQDIRVVPPGHAFALDIEKRQLSIPCDYASSSYLSWHYTAAAVESFLNGVRKLWPIWLVGGVVLVADVDIV